MNGRQNLGAPLLNPRELNRTETFTSSSKHLIKGMGKGIRRNETIFTAGMSLFVLGSSIESFSQVLDFADGPNMVVNDTTKLETYKKLSPDFSTAFLWSLFTAVGLILIVIADLDANQFLRRNRIRLVAMLLVWFINYLAETILARDGRFYALELLPFLFIAWRFDGIVEMRIRPHFTELFALVLSFDLIGFSGAWTLYVMNSPEPSPVLFDIVYIGILGPPCVLFSYRWSQRNNEPHTISLSTAILTYLFMMGSGIILGCFLAAAFDQAYASASLWVVGTIHLVPALTMLFLRRYVFKKIGRQWAKRRQHRGSVINLQSYQDMGNLAAVEDAISSDENLNAYCKLEIMMEGFEEERMQRFFSTANSNKAGAPMGNTLLTMRVSLPNRDSSTARVLTPQHASNDRYTLLHLACMGDHLDGVQRLLTLGEREGSNGHLDAVDIDAESDVKGETPIFMASKRGLLHCVEMLVEYGANVNKPAFDKQTPLMIAATEATSIRGTDEHVEIVKRLLEAGADKLATWMDLTTEDMACTTADDLQNSLGIPNTRGVMRERRTSQVLQALRALDNDRTEDRPWGSGEELQTMQRGSMGETSQASSDCGSSNTSNITDDVWGTCTTIGTIGTALGTNASSSTGKPDDTIASSTDSGYEGSQSVSAEADIISRTVSVHPRDITLSGGATEDSSESSLDGTRETSLRTSSNLSL
jgi:membrane protein implicated in regulation of membrane protease activity